MTTEQRTDRPDADDLRRDIERTREALGETVEALAAKADIAGRAREKRDEVKAATVAKAVTAKETVQTRAAGLTARVRQTSPGDARQAVLAAPATARRHPAPFVAAAALGLALAAWRATRGRATRGRAARRR